MIGWTLGFVVAAVLLVILSVRERVKLQKFRDKNWDVIGESKSSPLSRALANLIGTAGGIYLSVVLLVTFLELKVPERVNVMNLSMEPLAAISIVLALIQPFVVRLLQFRKRVW